MVTDLSRLIYTVRILWCGFSDKKCIPPPVPVHSNQSIPGRSRDSSGEQVTWPRRARCGILAKAGDCAVEKVQAGCAKVEEISAPAPPGENGRVPGGGWPPPLRNSFALTVPPRGSSRLKKSGPHPPNPRWFIFLSSYSIRSYFTYFLYIICFETQILCLCVSLSRMSIWVEKDLGNKAWRISFYVDIAGNRFIAVAASLKGYFFWECVC